MKDLSYINVQQKEAIVKPAINKNNQNDVTIVNWGFF